ncbi:hypothetical protein [Deinococcus depolymerans]|uniref:DUF1983 domain-containing protein n=1 Tax=Deinococcus depolymerans TaxID=392408 RepID=A0ABN1BTZ3_9DEIO
MTTLKGHPDVPAGTALNVRLIWDVPLQGAGRGLSPKHRDATYDWATGKYMDGQAELTFPHPRAGQNDNALRGPLVAVYTIGTGPLSQTARYPLQAYETAPGELDITVDPNPAAVVAAQTLIDLITGADVARTQAEEAAQRVNDAILDLEAERQAVADIIADTAQQQAEMGLTAVPNEAALTGKPAGGYRVLGTNERVYWSGAAITARAPMALSAQAGVTKTTRAALAAGGVTAGVGQRLADEHTPLTVRAAVGAEAGDGITTYALAGGLIAQREYTGPVYAAWAGVTPDFDLTTQTGTDWTAALTALLTYGNVVIEPGHYAVNDLRTGPATGYRVGWRMYAAGAVLHGLDNTKPVLTVQRQQELDLTPPLCTHVGAGLPQSSISSIPGTGADRDLTGNAYGLWLHRCQRFTVTAPSATRIRAFAINLSYCEDGEITDPYVYDTLSDGVHIGNASRRIRVRRPKIRNTGDDALAVDGYNHVGQDQTEDIEFSDVDVRDSFARLLSNLGGKNVRFLRGRATNSSSSAIRVYRDIALSSYTPTDTLIEGITVTDAGQRPRSPDDNPAPNRFGVDIGLDLTATPKQTLGAVGTVIRNVTTRNSAKRGLWAGGVGTVVDGGDFDGGELGSYVGVLAGDSATEGFGTTQTANIRGTVFRDSQASGVNIDRVTGSAASIKLINNAQHGANIYGCADFELINPEGAGNSTEADNLYAHIILASSTAPNNNIRVSGGRLRAGTGTKRARYGVRVETGTTNYRVENVDARGATRTDTATWAVSLQTPSIAFGDKSSIVNNAGHNPVGQLTTPAMSSSGTSFSNPYPYTVRVFVSGGTVSDIRVAGVVTGLTSGMVEVGPQETIRLTYSVVPQWIWLGR